MSDQVLKHLKSRRRFLKLAAFFGVSTVSVSDRLLAPD
jgi:hypothetical protein